MNRFVNICVKDIFTFLITITLLFSLFSLNLLLSGEYETNYTIVLIVLIFIFIIGTFFQGFRKILKKIFVVHQLRMSLFFLVFALIVQMLFLYCIHPVIGFDAGAIHNALLTPQNAEIRGYFSSNVNNIFPLMFQYWIVSLLHNSSWFLCESVTVFLVDLSALLNIGTVLIMDQAKFSLICYIQSVWLILYPMAIVPYTDNWVLPFVSLFIFLVSVFWVSNSSIAMKICASIISGVVLTLIYNMKPSGIVPVIAVFLMIMLSLCFSTKEKKRLLYKATVFTISFAIGFIPSFNFIKTQISHQRIVQVLPGREVPAIHFIQIGMSGDGGYSAHDALMMSVLQTKHQRVDYSQKKIREELSEKGINYVPFLIRKQGLNSSDGTFAWLREGHFINQRVNYNLKGIRGFFTSFTMPEGVNLHNYQFLAQIWWISIVIILNFSWSADGSIIQCLRLGIIGAFLYLLIFEGGRSRYIIQFLPMFLIMWSLVLEEAVWTIKTHTKKLTTKSKKYFKK
ncbi:hypothetical protein H9564_03145 [Limosilactobacillus sp. Sa3CUN2]|uniref:Integral membrane protein n=1 Tax=Limosilactobacillus avistercoris TaxID=2762243 RepID=A0ABR8PBR6_9LACO|nr:TIGR03766 family XrtG-associated glycosyltransferase [Limosilactobacillus avistercoris]MBD7894720.1 hypothetical protein [Limosilactobacillus avistercoris]